MLGAFWSHPTLNLPKRSPNNVEYKVEYKLSLTPELRQSRAWDLPEAQHARKPPPLTPEDPAGRGGGQISRLITWEGVDVPPAGPGRPVGRARHFQTAVFLGTPPLWWGGDVLATP